MSREYPGLPIPGAAVVVWRDGKVLLIRRRNEPGAGKWSLPSGIQELGETLAETARREVLEETGVACAVADAVHAYDVILRDAGARVRYHYTLVGFRARWLAGEPVAGDDAVAAEWVEVEEALRRVAWDDVRETIRRAGLQNTQ